jgi:hypothetical protein
MAKLDFLRVPPGAVLLAFVATSPALKEAFIDGTLQMTSALSRFVVAVVVLGILWRIIHSVGQEYANTNDTATARKNVAALLGAGDLAIDSTSAQTAVLPVVVDHDATR